MKDLLAKGLFFQFADHYYYMHPNEKYSSLNDDKLYDDFENYLADQKYKFHSPEEEEIDQVLTQMGGKSSGKNIVDGLSKVKKEFEKLGSGELKANKDDVDNEIRIELASRYNGDNGKTEESLNKDLQFQTAVKILSESHVYNKLLKL